MNSVYPIAFQTFLEVKKTKLLTIISLLSLFIIFITLLAANLTYGVPKKIVIDFTLGLLSISSIGIAIFFGVELIAREIENRTLYMILSRPVTRAEFIIGKILGLNLVLLVNTLILCVPALVLYQGYGGSLNPLVCGAIFFIYLEAMLVLLLAIGFSLFTNKVLASLFTIILLFSGHFVEDVLASRLISSMPMTKKFLEHYDLYFPAFYKLNLKEHVLFLEELDLTYFFNISFYAFIYASALVLLISFFFSKRDLK